MKRSFEKGITAESIEEQIKRGWIAKVNQFRMHRNDLEHFKQMIHLGRAMVKLHPLSTKISFLISLCLNYLLEGRRERSISSWGRWQRKVVSSYDPNEIQDRTYRIFSQNFEPYLIRHERWIGREREKNIKDSDDPIPRTVGSLSYCYFFKYLSN